MDISAVKSHQDECLQAADYMLWALQRLFEREDDRYWEFVKSKASLVHDVDDVQEKAYGTYYDKRNPLSLEAIKKGREYRVD